MSFMELVKTAIANTFRSRLRAVLTILAIFVGAFTLTLTNGLGTGIRNFINAQVSAFGANDIMSVQVPLDAGTGFPGQGEDGPAEYDPDQATMGAMTGFNIEALTERDIEALREIEGIISVEPLKLATADYIVGPSGTRYEIMLGSLPPGTDLDLRAGTGITDSQGSNQLLLPGDYVEPLGFESDEAAIGQEVSFGVSSVMGSQSEVTATIVGVQEETLFATGAIISWNLTDEIYGIMTDGLPPQVADLTMAAMVQFDASLGEAGLNRIKADIAELGLQGTTVADQLGVINTVITAVVGVLNAFAAIALVAAGFGIINTLYMSVQERTREIGLMKALGMGSGSIFGLFSLEAVFIGFLGSAIGSAVAIVLGLTVSGFLSQGALSALPGLQVFAFDPVSVAVVIVVVMVLAFLAGTLPARRAAQLDPIEALRYE